MYSGYKIAESKGATGWKMAGYMLGGGLIGGIAGVAGGFAGATVGVGIGIGGALGGAISGFIGGFTSGSINGFGMTLLAGGNWGTAIANAGKQGLWAGVIGAAVGGLVQGISSAIKGENVLWGNKGSQRFGTKHYKVQYDLKPDPDGGNMKLYRGMSGNESAGKELFMTDNYDYAFSYAKQYHSVVSEIEIPKYSLDLMMYNGDLVMQSGIYVMGDANTYYSEYVFSVRVSGEILKNLKP